MTDLYNEVLNSETMPLTAEQLEQLKCNYAQMVVDDMDIKTLMIMAYDVIVENLKDYDEEDMKEEIVELYDEEILEELMP
jgi:predicted ATP-dependent protease